MNRLNIEEDLGRYTRMQRSLRRNGRALGVALLLLLAAPAGRAQISLEGINNGPYVFANAARDGNYWFVRNSLVSGVSPNLRDSQQRPALVLAAMNGHSQVVDLLLQNNAQINITDPARNTALNLAAARGAADIVDALLRAHANVNLANGVGETPLFSAARNGQVRVVEALIRAGADVNQADFTGRTPLAATDRSSTSNRRAVADILTRAGGRR
jgi:ankyrin repeat protein